jgi:uncharacterized protein YjbJ (UPF0337 family)
MRYEGELKGKAKEIKGGAKEQLGKVVGNAEMQDKGEREKYEGRIQEKMGKARRQSR